MPSAAITALVAFAQTTLAPAATTPPHIERNAVVPPAASGASESPVDPETLAQRVMWEMSRQTEEDLRNVAEAVERENRRGAEIRAFARRLRRGPPATAGDPCQGQSFAEWRACVARVTARLPQMSVAYRNAISPQLDALRASLQPATEDDQAVAIVLQNARQAHEAEAPFALAARPPALPLRTPSAPQTLQGH